MLSIDQIRPTLTRCRFSVKITPNSSPHDEGTYELATVTN